MQSCLTSVFQKSLSLLNHPFCQSQERVFSVPRGTTLEPGARLDNLARGFYSPMERAFFDVRVSHPELLPTVFMRPLLRCMLPMRSKRLPNTITESFRLRKVPLPHCASQQLEAWDPNPWCLSKSWQTTWQELITSLTQSKHWSNGPLHSRSLYTAWQLWSRVCYHNQCPFWVEWRSS